MGGESVCDKSQTAMGMYVNGGGKKLRVYLRVLMKGKRKMNLVTRRKPKERKEL